MLRVARTSVNSIVATASRYETFIFSHHDDQKANAIPNPDFRSANPAAQFMAGIKPRFMERL
jgi:hypothetical protein